MTYQTKYLDMLKAEIGKKHPKGEPSKPSKPSFEAFEGTHQRPFPQKHTPALDADGVPCGGCPSCGQGEFWRYPEFHRGHDFNGWVCWFCSPPPRGSGPCDFCGVPDYMLVRATVDAKGIGQ